MAFTLTTIATYQEEIKKSRFLVWANTVQSPEDALNFLASHSVAEATHNCWAYKIGAEYRYNDDGEPGGTAGRPILQAIEGQQCDAVAVLVVRWFGGIKLGPGGLIRAYGGAAAQCLRLAAKTELIEEVEVECDCAFANLARVQSRLTAFGARIIDESFDSSGVRWRLAVPVSGLEALHEAFTDLTRGKGGWRLHA
jgi:uncharacterized YigZ family protein